MLHIVSVKVFVLFTMSSPKVGVELGKHGAVSALHMDFGDEIS